VGDDGAEEVRANTRGHGDNNSESGTPQKRRVRDLSCAVRDFFSRLIPIVLVCSIYIETPAILQMHTHGKSNGQILGPPHHFNRIRSQSVSVTYVFSRNKFVYPHAFVSEFSDQFVLCGQVQ
jgi:hypothetical protein